jgi:hypothetical protein
MSVVYYPTVRSGITSQKGYSTSAEFLHSTNDMDAGPRYSYAWRLNPLNSFNVTHTSISTADVATLEAFFNSMGGRYGSFIFLDPAGNLLPNSESYVDGSADPFKGTRAGHASTISQLVLPAGSAQGIYLTTSVWVYATAAGQQMNIGLTNSYQTITLPQNSWKRVWFTTQVPDNNPVTALIYTPVSTLMYGAQCSPLPGPGSYGKTPEMLGYHPNCRFDQDDFKTVYRSIDECSVTLQIAEFNQ